MPQQGGGGGSGSVLVLDKSKKEVETVACRALPCPALPLIWGGGGLCPGHDKDEVCPGVVVITHHPPPPMAAS